MTLIRLKLELHADWDDHDMDEQRRKWGARMQATGREWVIAVRKHVNNRIFFFYLYLTFARLQELSVENGHPASGDDSILERGNQIGKRLGRSTIHWGGNERRRLDGAPSEIQQVQAERRWRGRADGVRSREDQQRGAWPSR